MGGFTSLATAVSGLQAAQLGLSVTGHNMSNSEIAGYSRQRIVQRDAYYQKIGFSSYGVLKRGLGTDTGAVHQIRNQFLDLTYRTQTSKLNFYAVKSVVGSEIEGLLGEVQGAYKFQDVINDMWKSLQELSVHPEGIETRYSFLATCQSFLTKANEVYDSLFDYQHNLDQQIRDAVMGEEGINALVTRVKELNKIISAGEASGDNANDYRDERNLCLDKLSALISIDYSEDSYGNISIFSDGHQLLSQNSQNYMGLKFTASNYSFVEPVFTTSKTILPANTPPSDFEPYMNYTLPISANRGNDNGSLKGLMVARGAMPAYYNGADSVKEPDPADYANDTQGRRDYEAAVYNYQALTWSVENCLVPKTMIALDSIVNKIVTLVNDTLAPYVNGAQDPNAPYDLNGNKSYVEVFVRKYVDRWKDDGTYNDVEKGNYYSQYSIGNLKINDLLINEEGGYNYLALSKNGDREDQSLLKDLLQNWSSDSGPYSINIDGTTYRIQDAYDKFIIRLANEFQEANNFVDYQMTQVTQADNQRNSVMGVSMDEEMSNMMKYQYAYNAAARILNVIDGMLDKIINGMVR